MPRVTERTLVLIIALQLSLVGAARADQPLDLSLEPSDVAANETPLALGADESAPTYEEPGPGEPGWSVRPEVELDMKSGTDDDLLQAINPDVESLGVRLKGTW